MFGKKTKSVAQNTGTGRTIKSSEKSVLDWEVSRIESIEQSERRAWKVAGAFGVCFALAVLGLALLLPLKENTPFVVRVNDTTGAVDVVTSIRGGKIAPDEAMDKYFIGNFIRTRENYDWYLLENDYLTVKELSDPGVFAAYANIYNQPNSPDKTYGVKNLIKVDITSISLNGNGIATVRFTKTNILKESNAIVGRSYWTASIGYEYSPNILMTESQRLINPFGFKVTSYRLDAEVNNM